MAFGNFTTRCLCRRRQLSEFAPPPSLMEATAWVGGRRDGAARPWNIRKEGGNTVDYWLTVRGAWTTVKAYQPTPERTRHVPYCYVDSVPHPDSRSLPSRGGCFPGAMMLGILLIVVAIEAVCFVTMIMRGE